MSARWLGGRGAYVGVGLDLLLTVVFAALGAQPVLDFVTAHRRESAIALASLHCVVAPAAFLTGLWRGDELGLAREDTRLAKATSAVFLGFLVLGWLMPVCAAATTSIPTPLFMAMIWVHVAPVVVLVLAALVGLDKQVDAFVRAMAGRTGTTVLGVLFAVYLLLVESFLVIVGHRVGDLGQMALPAWVISYLPARLLFARLTGLRGAERWTFVASNVHLIVRLLLLRF